MLLSLLFATAATSALAADPAVCTTFEKARNGQVVESRTEIHYGAGYILRNGIKAPFLADQRFALPGVPALVAEWRACNALSDKAEGGGFSPRMECSSRVMAKHLTPAEGEAGLDGMAKLGLVFMLIVENAPEDEDAPKVTMDLTRVASARALQLDKGNKFGIPGLYEYYDAAGALLGRYLVNTPLLLECR